MTKEKTCDIMKVHRSKEDSVRWEKSKFFLKKLLTKKIARDIINELRLFGAAKYLDK